MALTTFLIAVVLRFVLMYKDTLDWSQALTIGSILSATDPVAVVALLKELGTSVNINMLLEGESLLNDGTGTVFFMVFITWYEEGGFSVGDFFHKFFRLALGGPLLGFLMGFFFYPILKKIMKFESSFVISTVILAYFTFYISESEIFKIKVSGILALVVLGLYFSYKLKGRVVGHVEEAMHVVWHFLAYVIETLLFLITGGFLGAFFVNKDQAGLYVSDLSSSFIWKIIIFQILLLLLRGLVTTLCWPLLNKIGKK